MNLMKRRTDRKYLVGNVVIYVLVFNGLTNLNIIQIVNAYYVSDHNDTFFYFEEWEIRGLELNSDLQSSCEILHRLEMGTKHCL